MEFFADMVKKPERLIIGLMSGSSLDGIDAALMKIKGHGKSTSYQMIKFLCRDFEPKIKEHLIGLFDYRNSTVDKICIMNEILGELYSEATLDLIAQAGYKPEEIDLIGVWPLMAYHLPGRSNPVDMLGYHIGAVLQLGDINVIAERTGITTIGSFCARDIAAGGNGAPLTGLGDYIIYHDPVKNRAIQNIGGIANVNLVPANGGLSNIIGFDTGPGNMVIDAVVRQITNGGLQYDKDGRMASAGSVNTELVEHFLKDTFIQKAPPKAAGRENFGEHFTRKFISMAKERGCTDNDMVASATALTVEAIAQSYEKYLMPLASLDEVIVGGGGALNKGLMRMLQKRLSPIPVKTDDDYGISSFAKEAMYMAFLANETLFGTPNNVPSVTGCTRPVVMGTIAPAYPKKLDESDFMQD